MQLDQVSNTVSFLRTLGLLAFTGFMAKVNRELIAYRRIYGDLETQMNGKCVRKLNQFSHA